MADAEIEAASGTTALTRRRAEESVSLRFTRLMKATTSPYGVLTDPPIVAVVTALLLMAVLVARSYGIGGPTLLLLQLIMALPLAAAASLTLALAGARATLVDWLAGLPFAVENMNAVLNGLGDSLEITFAGELPATERLNADLDRLHSDCFVTEAAPDEKRLTVRIGVVDSKRNPAATNHQRYARVRALVDQVLVPLSATHPIVEVRVK
jgi:hypothetical protein